MLNNPDQYQQTRWRLTKLLSAPEGSAVDEALQELEAAITAIENLRPSLSPEMKGGDFARVLEAVERLAAVANRIGAYGPLWFSEDTQDQAALAFMGRMDQRLTEAQNRTLFFNLWWKGLEDEAAARLRQSVSEDLRYYLDQARKLKDHTLTEPEEKVINLKNVNGVNAMTTIYDMITNKFVFNLEVEGQLKQLTRDELMTYVRAPGPELRAAAYQEQFRVYEREASVLAQIYIHRVRDWASENISLRRFTSPLSVRNIMNDVPDEIVNILLDVCAEQATVFQRYFQLKAGWLKLPEGKLRRYDIYAPLNKQSNKKIGYGQAVDIVLSSLGEFSPVVADRAWRVFKDGHIDAEIRPGKRGGAFCASVLPGTTPWVLANYTGEPRQVATLAHELGHAVHALLAAEHSVLTFHSALPLAETASVFSEMLLMDRLLAEESDLAVRRDLLAEAVDDMYATVLRQAYFVIFEREAHRLITAGQTMHQLNQTYLTTLHRQFGDAVDVSEDFQREWLAIPHIFHTPFYCYAYSFGQLLALSLYQQFKQEGKSFTPKLLKILSYGGSASPSHILGEAGIDIADPDFWRNGFRVVEGMIDELADL